MSDKKDVSVPEREVCMCFHVPLGKLVNYYHRENLKVASQLSECLGAGTGCGWCVPFLEKIFDQLENGETPTMKMSPDEYKNRRAEFRKKVSDKGLDDVLGEF